LGYLFYLQFRVRHSVAMIWMRNLWVIFLKWHTVSTNCYKKDCKIEFFIKLKCKCWLSRTLLIFLVCARKWLHWESCTLPVHKKLVKWNAYKRLHTLDIIQFLSPFSSVDWVNLRAVLLIYFAIHSRKYVNMSLREDTNYNS
jgi:hypothetical protein